MRRSIVTASVILVLAATTFGVSPVQARRSEPDPRQEREKVRQEQADVAATVDALEADQATVEQALRDLQTNVDGKQSEVDTAEVEVQEANQRALDASAQVDARELELAGYRSELKEAAVEAYVGNEDSAGSFALGAESFNEASERQALYEMQATDTSDVIDKVRAVRSELESQREEAETAGEEAQVREDEAALQLDELEAAQAQQEEFAADVETRIDSSLARSIELAETDQELSNQIAMEEAALAARLREAELARQQEEARKAEEARRAAEEEERRKRPGTPAPDPAPTPPPDGGGSSGAVTPIGTSGGVALCKTSGFTVACRIGQSTADLIAAARGDGVNLTGWGYRDPARQIQLRREHCGTSQYAIYEMPASQCTPPTAKPGTSMHEIGLAIDFENCSSRSSGCYLWLRDNAARFGFKNLPTEAWHWSINGN